MLRRQGPRKGREKVRRRRPLFERRPATFSAVRNFNRRRKGRQLKPTTQHLPSARKPLLHRQNQWRRRQQMDKQVSGKWPRGKPKKKHPKATSQTSGKRRLSSESDCNNPSSLDGETLERQPLQKRRQNSEMDDKASQPPGTGSCDDPGVPQTQCPTRNDVANASQLRDTGSKDTSGAPELRETGSCDVFEEEQMEAAEDNPIPSAYKTPPMSPEQNKPCMKNQEGFLSPTNVKLLAHTMGMQEHPEGLGLARTNGRSLIVSLSSARLSPTYRTGGWTPASSAWTRRRLLTGYRTPTWTCFPKWGLGRESAIGSNCSTQTSVAQSQSTSGNLKVSRSNLESDRAVLCPRSCLFAVLNPLLSLLGRMRA
ncbi:uncharacterized protein [Heterodontus francisci]|uniref:uncharacterized protein n=1 Tax=Heterodontus francisci TaxID=7792 RepID=UPI00355AD6C3